MFFPYDFTHTFIILLFTAGASSGVLNRIGFANKTAGGIGYPGSRTGWI
jgi:hypothetical protein